MKTTKQWLSEVKSSPEKLTQWLERQYIGEQLAAERISALAESRRDTRYGKVLERIADDESKHAQWVANLLTSRGLRPPTPTMEGTR